MCGATKFVLDEVTAWGQILGLRGHYLRRGREVGCPANWPIGLPLCQGSRMLAAQYSFAVISALPTKQRARCLLVSRSSSDSRGPRPEREHRTRSERDEERGANRRGCLRKARPGPKYSDERGRTRALLHEKDFRQRRWEGRPS
jgi:hypothetical protein